ncbi:hypothetical protein BU17DRAFT_72197 [Hysterangium stoloniferum]|nr:hypothetical protein BU17DRAFT_72197 [Hysterangium stoloniferum]
MDNPGRGAPLLFEGHRHTTPSSLHDKPKESKCQYNGYPVTIVEQCRELQTAHHTLKICYIENRLESFASVILFIVAEFTESLFGNFREIYIQEILYSDGTDYSPRYFVGHRGMEVAGGALPVSPAGLSLLGKVKEVLGVLKVCHCAVHAGPILNLLKTIDDHQKEFNDQLKRLEVEDMVVKIMEDYFLLSEDAPLRAHWEVVKNFVKGAMNVDSEKSKLEDYQKELVAAMDQFQFSLGMFLGFTVNAIKGGEVKSVAAGYGSTGRGCGGYSGYTHSQLRAKRWNQEL